MEDSCPESSHELTKLPSSVEAKENKNVLQAGLLPINGVNAAFGMLKNKQKLIFQAILFTILMKTVKYSI